MLSFIRSPGLSVRYRKIRLHLFSDKIVKMTLNVDQGHLRQQNSIANISGAYLEGGSEPAPPLTQQTLA